MPVPILADTEYRRTGDLWGLAPFSELLIKVSPLPDKKVPVPMPVKNVRLLKGLAPFSALLNNNPPSPEKKVPVPFSTAPFPTAPFPNTE